MKFATADTDALEKLGRHLTAAADRSDAEAVVHRTQGEEADALKQDNRAATARYYVKVLTRVTRQMREKDAPGRFTPPTAAQIEAAMFAYSSANHMPKIPGAEVQKFMAHYESVGWKIGGKTVMKSYEATARAWYLRWLEKQPGHDASEKLQQRDRDPAGWGEFWKARYPNKPLKSYRFAPEHVRDDFDKKRV